MSFYVYLYGGDTMKAIKRVLSLVLCGAMLLGYFPAVSFAAEADGLCAHHTAHENCGYVETADGATCDYVCEVCASEESVTEETQESEPAAENETDTAEPPELDSVSWTNPFMDVPAEMQEEAAAFAIPFTRRRVYHTDAVAAGLELRSAMVNRMEAVAIGYRIPADQFSNEGFSAIVDEITGEALVHTGVPNEGDYLFNHLSSWSCNIESTIPGENNTYYDATLVFQIAMNTTADEEAAVDQQVDLLLANLNTTGTDYDKIKSIYDWICDNVHYDYTYLNSLNQGGTVNLLKHSAYAALVEKKTVCQGYSNLLYRLALEAGINCRIILGSSYGERHSWNIVKIDGKYYNLDSTWDADQVGTYAYFLKSNSNFPDHTRDAEYLSSVFLSQHPMADADYVPNADAEEYVDGDFTFRIENGSATLIAYTGHAREVTIPGTANGVPVEILGATAFRGNETIEKVIFTASIVSTEDGWFEGYEYEPFGTFANCTNLKIVVIPENAVLTRLGEITFFGCKNLKNIELPSSVKELGLSCFEMCEAMTSINLPEGLEVVAQNVFTGTGLRSVTIPASCYLFHEFNTMPELEMFAVAAGNTRYRAHEGVLYDNQPPTGDSGWTLVGYPYSKAGDSYRVADFCIHIYGDVFAGADKLPKNLKTLYIGNANASQGLGGGISLSRVRARVVPDASNPYFVSHNGMLFTKNMKTLVQVPSDLTGTVTVPEGVKSVEAYAAELGSYSSLILPEGVTTLGSAVFWQTDSVKSIYIPASVTTVTGDSLFQQCYNLQDVYYGGTQEQWNGVFNPAGVAYGPLYLAPDFNLHCNYKIPGGQPDPVQSSVVVSEDCRTMTITYASNKNLKSIQFAVWSEAGGQDDLKWYTAEKDTDGRWTNEVELSLHRSTGKYYIHVYSVEDGAYTKQTEFTATVKKEIPPGSGVVMSDDFETMTITYAKRKNHEHVHFAVWSEMGAHDDLHWYAAVKNAAGEWTYTVNMDEYNTAGKYYVHVYSIDGGVYTMQAEYTVNVEMEDAPVYGDVQVSGNSAVMTITYADGRDYQHLHYAVWSDVGGHDDLQWYAATETAKGVWTYLVDLSLHRSAGSYSIHAYSIADGVYTKQGEYTAYVKKAVSVSSLAKVSNDCKTMTISYTGNNDCKDIRYAVWSTAGGQDDLTWYTAAKTADGSWKYIVDLSAHNTAGTYIIHVYNLNGGVYTKLAEYTAQVKKAVSASEGVTLTADSKSMIITFADEQKHDHVQCAVWSEKGGQDDLKWYNSENINGKWRCTVDLTVHNTKGKYQIHVYSIDGGVYTKLTEYTATV